MLKLIFFVSIDIMTKIKTVITKELVNEFSKYFFCSMDLKNKIKKHSSKKVNVRVTNPNAEIVLVGYVLIGKIAKMSAIRDAKRYKEKNFIKELLVLVNVIFKE